MISKKDALILGVAVIGGLGAATMLAGDDNGGAAERAIPGGILGAPTGAAPTVYQFAAQPAVTFPKAPTFDVGKVLAPIKVDPRQTELKKYYAQQAAGRWMIDPRRVRTILSAPIEKIGKPSPAIKEMGFAPAPTYIKGVGYGVGVYPKTPAKEIKYLPAARLPAAIGISTALKYARAGTSKKEIVE